MSQPANSGADPSIETDRGRPPRLLYYLLRRCLPEGSAGASILGDLHEEYQRFRPLYLRRLWYGSVVLNLLGDRFFSRLRGDGRSPRDPGRARAGLLDHLFQDLRYALRMLIKQPGFAVVVCATLALGIGANTALFSVIYGVLLHPLPYEAPDRLVRLWEGNTNLGWEYNSFPAADLGDLREQNETFEAISMFFSGQVTLDQDGEPQRIEVQTVTADLFSVLRAQPEIGRALRLDDEISEGEGVAVLSHGTWQRRFGGDPGVIGSRISLDQESFTIVGVMRADLRPIGGEPELWLPLRLTPERRQLRSNHFLLGVGRLRPGVNIEQARADLDTINARLVEQYPDLKTGDFANLVPLKETIVGEVRPALLLIMGAAALVLLIGCANVANLFLSRAVTRRREMAVRAALGAGRGRLVRQLGIESLVLALIGGAAGLLLAYAGVRAFLSLEPGNLPRAETITTNAPVLLFCLLTSALASLLFGIAPALLASRTDLTTSLKEAGVASSQSSAARRSKGALAVVQMAMAIVLLIGAGLLVRSFERLLRVDPGFESANILMARTYLDGRSYPEEDDAVRFHNELLDRLAASPAVAGAATVSYPPLSGGGQWWLRISGRELEGDSPPVVSFLIASPGYFDVIGSRLQAGRFFDEGDRADSQYVAIINQAMAREYWPDEDPIGERIRLGPPEASELEVVGVVSDFRQYAVDREPFPAAFLPYAQRPIQSFNVVIDVRGDLATATETLRSTVRSLDPNLALYWIMTLDDYLREDFAGPRFAMMLAAAFAFVALGIAAVGIYGVLSYAVSQRTHEIGVRLALGARPRQMVSLIVRQGLVMAAIALALGLTAAFGLTAGMQSMLFEVSATDPLTFVLVPAIVVAIALVACTVPALRAAGLDPLRALRTE